MAAEHEVSQVTELDLDTDLSPTDQPFKYKGTHYILREASAGAVYRWRNALIKNSKIGAEGNRIPSEGYPDTDLLLLSLCIFDTNDKPVSEGTIKGWSFRVQQQLLDKLLTISKLKDEPDTEDELLAAIAELQKNLDTLRASPGQDVQAASLTELAEKNS